ncbi:MAG: ankyrin repeat domain-containing protein [Spirochaetales bacterium]|nr:ankyrin repeat domain-containing protein [Spirochaetales bacterium]
MSDQNTFFKAVYEGELGEVKKMVAGGVDINMKGIHPRYTKPGILDCSALHLACDRGEKMIVQFLVEHGAWINIKQTGKYGYDQTPLYIAVDNGQSAIAELLMRNGADIHSVTASGHTILDAAARRGLLWLVSELVNKGLPVQKNNPVMTPLYYALRNGHKEVVDYLRGNGAVLKEEPVYFFAACHGGLLYIIEEFLTSGFSLSITDEEGFTPLHFAAMGKNTFELAQFLLNHKANPNAMVKAGFYIKETPLLLAAASGNKEVARLLLKYGVDINAKDEFGRTPLLKAAYEMEFCAPEQKKKYLSFIKLLILNNADIHTPMGIEVNLDFRHKSFIFWGVEHNYPAIVAACIKKKADITVETIINQNPLYFAAEKGFTKICTLLLEAGADLNYQGYQKKTPLMLSAENGHSQTAEMLYNRGPDISLKDEKNRTHLHTAAAGGLDWLVKELIAQGIDVNAPHIYGENPLAEALYNRHYHTARLLIELGADVNNKGLGNRTPLHYACNGGAEPGIILLLLQHGANPDNKTDSYNMETPLHQAADNGFVKIVTYLLEYGADPEIEDGNGETPLCRAAGKGNFEIVKLLVEKGARITADQKHGLSAIQHAINNNDNTMLEYLLAHNNEGKNAAPGKDMSRHIDEQLLMAIKSDNWPKIYTWLEKDVDVNYRDKTGKTPLFYAVLNNNCSVAKKLIQMGADIHLTDGEGKKAVDYLVKSESEEMKELLEHPVTLFEKVEAFAQHLRGRASLPEIQKAVELIKKDNTLYPTVTEKELVKIKTLQTNESSNLADTIEKARNAELYTHGICSHCGRRTLKGLDRDVLHGNPYSPASNTEVVWHCVCLSCGLKDDVYV